MIERRTGFAIVGGFALATTATIFLGWQFAIYQYISWPDPPFSFRSIFEGISSLSMVVLTAGILIIYMQQRNILSSQKKLTEYQQSSILPVHTFNVVPLVETQNMFDIRDNYYLYYSDFVEFEISNYGTAPAHHFLAEIYLSADSEYAAFPVPAIKGEWDSVSERYFSENVSQIFRNAEGSGVPANIENRHMSAPLVALVNSVPPEWLTSTYFGVYRFLGPSGILEHMAENVDSSIIVGIQIWYKDGAGNQGPIHIRHVEVDPDDLISRSEYLDGDYSLEEDRIDLHQIIHEIGVDADDEDIPDLDHPLERENE